MYSDSSTVTRRPTSEQSGFEFLNESACKLIEFGIFLPFTLKCKKRKSYASELTRKALYDDIVFNI